MTSQPVDAVFFWRYSRPSVYKPVYGRPAPATSYSKDYLQPDATLSKALTDVLGQPPRDFTWRWPGGEDTGGKLSSHQSGVARLDLRWTTTTGAPKPWRLTPDPSVDTVEVLAGNPGLDTEVAADAEIAQVIASGENPWMLAVHIVGDGPVLHPRLVLESPQPGREYASWNHLPITLRSAMSRLGSSAIQGFFRPEGGLSVRAQEIYDDVMAAFDENPNVLLVGPPGTGKTVAMEDIRNEFESGAIMRFDPDKNHGAFEEGAGIAAQVRTVVFHPSYAYEHFVIGLLPDVDPGSKQTIVKPHVGPLIELATHASQSGQRSLLICDEFNRGNAAAIFGDTIALLDVDKRDDPDLGGGAQIDTPFHNLAPKTADGVALGPQLRLPKNLYILAAMNSADRSVAPIDAALRRRFAIIHVGPNYGVLRAHLSIPKEFVNDNGSTKPGSVDEWVSPEHGKAVAVAVLEALNGRIEAVLGRDFLLGHSTMWHVAGGNIEEVLQSVAHALDRNVLGTLQLAFVDNDAALAAVLNVPTDAEVTSEEDVAATWQPAPRGTEEVAPAARLRLTAFSALAPDRLRAALASLLGQ